MLAAPVKFLVRALALLPVAVRPGLFLGVSFVVLWLAFVRHGVANVWHAPFRIAAWLIYLGLGLVLLPEYVATRARRRRGLEPWPAAIAIGSVTDRVSDAAIDLYERHAPPETSRRPPWWLAGMIAAICTGGWIVMDSLPVTDEAKYELAAAFQRWRDVETWADVDPERRAESGTPIQPLPRVARTSRGGSRVNVRLRCMKSAPCVGRVVVTDPAGEELKSDFVAVQPRQSAKVRFTLAENINVRALEVHVKRP